MTLDLFPGLPHSPPLCPFWSYYGGKWRAARYYPAPAHKTIIEPFAGAAGYSCRYPGKRIILLDKDPVIVGLWRYLLRASESDILALPDLREGQTVDDLAVCQEARWLIGWWVNKGTATPCKRPSKWMRNAETYRTGGSASTQWWGPEMRSRIARQLPAIRHWQIIEGSYEQAPDIPATWFIDPPYAVQGSYYKHGSKGIDYAALGAWCRSRQGQVMVCEQEGADWMPFVFFRDIKAMEGAHGRKRSREVIWCGGRP